MSDERVPRLNEGAAIGYAPVLHERLPDEDADALTTPEALQVVMLRTAALRGRRLSARTLKARLTPEQLRLWHELAMYPAIMLQDRLMAIALNGVREECLTCLGTGRKDGAACPRCRGRGWVKVPADPRLVKLALDASLDVKDRTLGKPTERVQIAQAVRVIMGGVDPARLPDPEPERPERLDDPE